MIFIKGLGLQLANAGGLQAQVRNRDHKNKFFYLSPSPPVPLTALGLKPVMVILHPFRSLLGLGFRFVTLLHFRHRFSPMKP
mgnify:CR=1 FL=1